MDLTEAAANLVEVSLAQFERGTADYEARLYRVMQRRFREQKYLLLKGLRERRLEWPVQESIFFAVFDGVWMGVGAATATGKAREDFETAVRGAAAQGMRDEALAVMQRSFDSMFSVQHPRAVQYASSRAAQMVTQVDGTTRDILRGIVTNAVESGQGYLATERQIKVRFEEFAEPKPQKHIQNRARLVARAESSMAYAEGQHVMIEEMGSYGLHFVKKWLTSRDAKVSEGCRANGEAGWIPDAREFPSGHLRNPRFPGCRCSTQYKLDREALTEAGALKVDGSTREWRGIRDQVLERDPICRHCGLEPSTEVDHLVTNAEGGTDTMANLRGVCHACHVMKTNRDRAEQKR